jgi:hypothetical protein
MLCNVSVTTEIAARSKESVMYVDERLSLVTFLKADERRVHAIISTKGIRKIYT